MKKKSFQKRMAGVLASVIMGSIVCATVFAGEAKTEDPAGITIPDGDIPSVSADIPENGPPEQERLILSSDQAGLPGSGLSEPDDTIEATGDNDIPTLEMSVFNIGSMSSVYKYISFVISDYAMSMEEDAALSFEEKMESGKVARFPEIVELGYKSDRVEFLLYGLSSDHNYKFDHYDPVTDTVLSSTRETAPAMFTKYVMVGCGIYRLHIITNPGTPEESRQIMYIYSDGLDDIPPVIQNVTVRGAGNYYADKNNEIHYESAELEMAAADEISGLHKTAPYSLDGVEWQKSAVFPVSRNGIYRIYVRDKHSNISSEEAEVGFIDSDPPEVTVSEDKSDCINGYHRTARIFVEAEDETGFPEDAVSIDGGEWQEKRYLTVSENGPHAFVVRDLFGYSAEDTIDVTDIDLSGPAVNYSIRSENPAGDYAKSRTICIEAEDTEAGLDEKAYSFDDGKTWQAASEYQISQDQNVPVRVRDALGNQSERREIEITGIDCIKPVIDSVTEKRVGESGIYARGAYLTVNAHDNESGLADKYLSSDKGENWTAAREIPALRSDDYMIYVKDAVGNIETRKAEVRNIDTEAPSCVITGNPENLTYSKAELRFHLEDRGSGIKSVKIKEEKAGVWTSLKECAADENGRGKVSADLSLTITSNGTYIIAVSDMCGNEENYSVKVTKIVKPSASSSSPKDEDDDDSGRKSSRSSSRKTSSSSSSAATKSSSSSKANSEETDGKKSIVIRSSGTEYDEDVSGNRSARTGGSRTRLSDMDPWKDENILSGNGVEDGSNAEETETYEEDLYSTDVYESYGTVNTAANGTGGNVLEVLPDPDFTAPDEAKEENSKTPVIIGTIVVIILFLSGLTVFWLMKKGIIPRPGGAEEEEE